MTRTTIATFGRYGSRVNVFAMMLDGETVARVEWRESVGRESRRKTQTFRGTKRDREAAAKAYAEGVVTRLTSGDAPPPKRLTVGELWTAYTTAHAPDWRPTTAKLNAGRWRSLTLHVSPLTWADLVQPETLDEWRKALLETDTKRGEPMARNQVAHHLTLVKSVWRFAKQRKLLADNPLVDYTIRKGRDYEARVVPEFTSVEWGQILAQFSPRSPVQWRAWAAIALDGLLAPRSNALLRLRWADVDLTKRTVTWQGVTDKIGKTRTQPLPRDAVFVLRVCAVWSRRAGNASGFVFFGAQDRTKGNPWTYGALNAALHTACRAAGIEVVPFRAMHGLRRMSANNVLAATGDITKVGDWLGDSDLKVLRKSYLRSRVGHLDTVVASATLPNRDKTSNETATDAVRASEGEDTK